MSNSWPMVLLGEVVRHRKEFIRISDFETYKRCRVQLHAKGIVLRDTVPGSEIKTKEQQVCRAREFLVAEIDAKVGGFGVVADDLAGSIVSSHYFLFEISQEKLDHRFLDYFVRTPSFMDQVAARGSTNYAAIRPQHVLEYQIPLPPLPEQRRIVARIDELAARISEAIRLRQEVVEEGELLARSSARRIVFGLTKYGTKPVGDLVTVTGGGTPSKANPFFWQGAIPWISPKDMKSREVIDASDHISEEAVVESAAKLLNPGCVLIVVRGMILAHTVPSTVLRVPATINQDMKALFPNDGLLPEYLCAAFWALNDDLVGLVEKSTHDTRKLETQKLFNFRIPVPHQTEQRRIVAHLDNLQTKAEAVKRLQAKTAAELDAMLPSILDKAFRGEL